MTDGGKKESSTPTSLSLGEAADPRHLVRALANAGVGLCGQDTTLTYVWCENAPLKWGSRSLVGRGDSDVFSAVAAQNLTRIKSDILSGGDARRTHLEVVGADGTSWFELWLDPMLSPDGAIVGIVTTVTEITEQRQREQTLRTLLREVSHRSKNLLAIIQSIAVQTGRYADTIEEFLTRFRGRLQSLSSSQDLVTSSNWRGADLSHLAAGQVARYCADPQNNLVLAGENPYLNPNAALHVGLALHELAVNSVSYGALSSPDGSVRIEVNPLADGEMELVWSEAFTGPDPDLERKRFGTVALERVVPSSLNSTAKLSAENGRLIYRLVLPADSFHVD